ncbi:hypothetical protein BgiMline_019829, partial [Biomphalaria glabrata]
FMLLLRHPNSCYSYSISVSSNIPGIDSYTKKLNLRAKPARRKDPLHQRTLSTKLLI